MPRTPPWLDTTTIRPRPAARMDGNSALVSAIGPKRLVEKICCQTAVGHVLDGSDGGDPGVVHEDVGCADRLLDGLGGSGDRRRVVEVESDAEQARIVGGGTGRRAQAFESRVGRAHRSDDAPSQPGTDGRRTPGRVRATHR